MMRDEELRFECLRLAVATGQNNPVALAKDFESYVTARPVREAEARLAAVGAALKGGTDA